MRERCAPKLDNEVNGTNNRGLRSATIIQSKYHQLQRVALSLPLTEHRYPSRWRWRPCPRSPACRPCTVWDHLHVLTQVDCLNRVRHQPRSSSTYLSHTVVLWGAKFSKD